MRSGLLAGIPNTARSRQIPAILRTSLQLRFDRIPQILKLRHHFLQVAPLDIWDGYRLPGRDWLPNSSDGHGRTVARVTLYIPATYHHSPAFCYPACLLPLCPYLPLPTSPLPYQRLRRTFNIAGRHACLRAAAGDVADVDAAFMLAVVACILLLTAYTYACLAPPATCRRRLPASTFCACHRLPPRLAPLCCLPYRVPCLPLPHHPTCYPSHNSYLLPLPLPIHPHAPDPTCRPHPTPWMVVTPATRCPSGHLA